MSEAGLGIPHNSIQGDVHEKEKSAKLDLVLPLDATLHYLPNADTFCIDEYPNLSLIETDGLEILSIHGGQLDKQVFLSIIQKRSVRILRGRQSFFQLREKALPVTIPIRILGLSMENSITSFQLLGHSHPE